jgi:Transposase IS116/IS110/IS902 family
VCRKPNPQRDADPGRLAACEQAKSRENGSSRKPTHDRHNKQLQPTLSDAARRTLSGNRHCARRPRAATARCPIVPFRREGSSGTARGSIGHQWPALGGVRRPWQHHAFLVGVHLDLIDRHTAAIGEITARDRGHDETVSWVPDLTCSIPGIGPINADVIVAETGADMTRFPTAGQHLASWAGTTPGHNESAGRVKSTRQPLPAGSRRRRAGVRAEPEQLPRGPGPADRVARGGPHHHADLAGSTALEDSGLTAANTSV